MSRVGDSSPARNCRVHLLTDNCPRVRIRPDLERPVVGALLAGPVCYEGFVLAFPLCVHPHRPCLFRISPSSGCGGNVINRLSVDLFPNPGHRSCHPLFGVMAGLFPPLTASSRRKSVCVLGRLVGAGCAGAKVLNAGALLEICQRGVLRSLPYQGSSARRSRLERVLNVCQLCLIMGTGAFRWSHTKRRVLGSPGLPDPKSPYIFL